ncbi:MAG TPA: hypothetical protein VGP63_24105, partial [Planctomycetaceae bacterium]|nr:hypothetical protein [Planctomycetaceae bacterium]
MGRTPRRHAETARELTLVSMFRLGLAMLAACLLCVATSVAADDAPTKTQKSDDASASLKSSGSPSKGSSKAEKSWGSESAAPKP